MFLYGRLGALMAYFIILGSGVPTYDIHDYYKRRFCYGNHFGVVFLQQLKYAIVSFEILYKFI